MFPAPGFVGVFDSGLGGLSVLPHIRQLLPNESVLYIADAAHLPYGERSLDYVLTRAHCLTRFFLDRGAKAIAIPCNTATAAAVAVLRSSYPDTPFIGIEPAVKPAARLTRSGTVGVLATTGTLISDKFKALVEREAPACQVLLKPCPDWVLAVEEDWTPADRLRIVQAPVQALLDAGADTLVLGCTHFPLLLPEIQQVAGPHVHLLDTGAPFARELQRQLNARALLRVETGDAQVFFASTNNAPALLSRAERLAGLPLIALPWQETLAFEQGRPA